MSRENNDHVHAGGKALAPGRDDLSTGVPLGAKNAPKLALVFLFLFRYREGPRDNFGEDEQGAEAGHPLRDVISTPRGDMAFAMSCPWLNMVHASKARTGSVPN